MRAVWLQSLRRKDMYLLVFVMVCFAVGAVLARYLGKPTIEMIHFLGSLGLSLGSIVSGLLAVIVASQQLPSEIGSRTIYPVLAGPVRRSDVIWGKFLPTWMLASGMYVFCVLVTLAVTPSLPAQSPLMLAESTILKVAALAALVMMVVGLSIHMPTSVTLILGGLIYLGGGAIRTFFGQSLPEKGPLSRAGWLMPDFKLMDMSSRYVDGGAALAGGEILAACIYVALWFGLFTVITITLFRRKAL